MVLLPACNLLRGKTAIVTGGVTGIGRAITLAYLRQGANVVVGHLGLKSDKGHKDSLVEEAGRLKEQVSAGSASVGELVTLAGDVAEPETGERLVKKAVERWGGLDVCVANAGVFKPRGFLEIDQDLYQQSMRVNVDGTFHTCQAAARQMVAQGRGGSIIATSSVSALVGGGLQVHYTPTKAAVLSMMQSMAIALGKHKIRCNALLPGTIDTQLADHDMKNPEKKAYLEKRVPLGRVGRPEEMAGPAVFLACEDFSSYVNGRWEYTRRSAAAAAWARQLLDSRIASPNNTVSVTTVRTFAPIMTDTAAERRARRARTRKPRGRGLRTRTGCITCRKRHVKCDEGTPVCGPCAKRGHECIYGEPTPARPRLERPSSVPVEEEADKPPAQSPPEAPPEDSCYDITIPEISQHDLDEATNFQAAATSGESPGSSVGSRPAVSTATAGWFGLLLDDAALDLESSAASLLDPELLLGHDPDSISQHLPLLSPSQQNTITEHSLWQCSERIQLSANECLLFENFVRRLGRWLDLFDQEDHFSTLVPRLAMYNTGLMNAILALSVRHISLNPHVAPDICHERADALKYYYETLHYLHKAMQFDSFKTSLELLATSLIVSTYEMLDGSRRDWERHLKGVFWIQRSQNIHGDSGGLKQANWWAWLCQDVWAAFREKRKVFSFWKHPRTFDQLNEHELACRAVFIFAKAVNYCSKEETEADKDSIQGRIARADALTRMLDEWQGLLTVKFSPLPIASGSESEPWLCN
ncbi:L-rhamnose-1-dehydrogenase [Lasiodiplodia theobromae]|uniref:L-rhamnose-1-dehydrogenase n=1 Tax=Lasiodiplodia theobromae TaxID=45133 RepID=A0A5N5DCQ9_9PEZI|nr:L-rhamnose-1-dehydrogenase [Lasiodiplodia theobromae]